MAGIFDRMNNPSTTGKKIPPAMLMGALGLTLVGRTNQNILDNLNAHLAPGDPLDQAAIDDLLAILSHIAAGADAKEKRDLATHIGVVAGIWERGWFSITETEARDMTGVTFT